MFGPPFWTGLFGRAFLDRPFGLAVAYNLRITLGPNTWHLSQNNYSRATRVEEGAPTTTQGGHGSETVRTDEIKRMLLFYLGVCPLSIFKT